MTNTAKPQAIIVLTTWPDQKRAEQIAEKMITDKLAACVNILPKMTSVYHWQGKLEKGQEHQLIIKTQSEKFAALEKLITTMHPYELPEILAIKITDGHNAYLDWIDQSLKAE
ncbi:MAG: divalent-cation tolerance protein CutA [Gammaproteobacteria bacterium]|nr:divalent-cation tolerance protein CutA [Gammaproteobacteria bacterium]